MTDEKAKRKLTAILSADVKGYSSLMADDEEETKLPLGYEYLGDQTVNNIKKPMGAYKVLMEPRVTRPGKEEKTPQVPWWQKKPVVAGAVVVLVFLMLCSMVQAQELEIRGPRTSLISKERAIVKGSVPRSSRCFEIRRTKVEKVKGSEWRVGVVDEKYKGLWLGVTVIITDASGRTEEKDFEARRVTGRFKEEYTAYGASILQGATRIRWIARLWEGKVYARACAEWNNGRPCKYCQRNGYHMYSPTGAKATW